MYFGVEVAEVEECSSRLKGWRWRLRGCSLGLRGEG